MFYLATSHGFMRAGHPSYFTCNIRLATPFPTFDSADEAGKALGTQVRFYAVLVTA